MSLGLRATSVMVICFLVGACHAQTNLAVSSLCELREKVPAGERVSVLVSGIYRSGLESSTIEADPSCPVHPYGDIWVEFDHPPDSDPLAKRNYKKLGKLVDDVKMGPKYVYLTVEGEFYAKPLPDPVLKGYQHYWGHLNCCETKLVVHKILDVKPAPTDPANGASLGHEAGHAEGITGTVASAKPKR